ncbi:hypothetical protein L1049_003621 [Liquidambar formosana]|uniref:Uncharacterized protein n=1 Tax=Liquidambar formosana TaxID=63359 RepID=A0AAP0WZS4_LIQFO
MSAKEDLALSNDGEGEDDASAKRGRFDRCYSFMEISIEPGPLKDLDSNKLKTQIKRWAKAVVAYARQVSGRLGSGRLGSSRR